MAYALFIVVTRIRPPKVSPSPVPEKTVKLYESQTRKTDIVTINVRDQSNSAVDNGIDWNHRKTVTIK